MEASDRRKFLKMSAGALATTALPPVASRSLAQAETFKVGVSRPLSGKFVSSFAPLFFGADIARDEINATGGILGRQIEFVIEDDEASPAMLPALIRKFADNGVHYLVGPAGSSATIAAAAPAADAGILYAGSALAAGLADGTKYPNHYQVYFNTDIQAEVMVDYLVETLKIKKVGILQENTAFGEGGTAGTIAALKKRGMTAASVQIYPVSTQDLNSYVANLRKASAEGILAWIATGPATALAFRAMGNVSYRPPVVGHVFLLEEVMFDIVPLDQLKNVFAIAYKNFTFSDHDEPGARQQLIAKNAAQYPETKGHLPLAVTNPFYDWLYLLKFHIEKEQTFDVQKIKAALDTTRNFDGLCGTINFTKQNHTGIGAKDITIAEVISFKTDPRATGPFRKRAPGLA